MRWYGEMSMGVTGKEAENGHRTHDISVQGQPALQNETLCYLPS